MREFKQNVPADEQGSKTRPSQSRRRVLAVRLLALGFVRAPGRLSTSRFCLPDRTVGHDRESLFIVNRIRAFFKVIWGALNKKNVLSRVC
jgi:hypothetical protein